MNLDDIRARHRPAIWHDTQWDPCDTDHPDACCSYCETFWPCDAAQLAALLTPERIAEALLSCNLIHRYREYAEQRPHRGMEHATDEWLAEAWAIQLHAALTKEPK